VHAQLKCSALNNDMLGVAQLVCSGGSHVHVESARSFSVRLPLTHRRALKRKFLDLENEIRHRLKVFGVEQSAIRRADSEARLRELIGADALLTALTGCCGRWRGQEYAKLDSLLVRTVDRTSSAGDSWRCGAWVWRGADVQYTETAGETGERRCDFNLEGDVSERLAKMATGRGLVQDSDHDRRAQSVFRRRVGNNLDERFNSKARLDKLLLQLNRVERD
jgi:hypothetical protein